jgi:hypothetical protein
MRHWKTEELIFGTYLLGAIALLVLLWFAMRVHETFADAESSGKLCFACTDYFSDALAINIDDVPLVGDEKDILAVIATKLGVAVEARAAFLNKVLDAITQFLDDRATTRPGGDGVATCQNILPTMEPTREYYNCMNKYVLAKFDCKPKEPSGSKLECSQVLPIVDLVMKKALICGKDCSDIKLYPRANEQAVCRQTSACKTVAELESNIRRFTNEVRGAVSNCQRSLSGSGDAECALTYAKALLTKKKAKAAIELSDAEKARGVQLGSGYGQNDVIFDMNTLVIGNGSANFT